MIRLLICLFAAIPGSAAALSCIIPDITQTYTDLGAAPETYTIAYGKFRGSPSRISQTRDAEVLRYRFEGKSVTKDGLGSVFNKRVIVTRTKPRPEFAAPGGRLETGKNVVVFLQVKSGKFYLTAGDCPYRQFYQPSTAEFGRLLSCMNGWDCSPPS